MRLRNIYGIKSFFKGEYDSEYWADLNHMIPNITQIYEVDIVCYTVKYITNININATIIRQ